MAKKPKIFMDLLYTPGTGWGNFGYQFVKFASLQGYEIIPLTRFRLELNHIPFQELELWRKVLMNALPYQEKFAKGEMIIDKDAILYTHMNWGDVQIGYPNLQVGRVVGICFFEYVHDAQMRAAKLNQGLDYVICGSYWNRDLLKQFGCTKAVTIWQGVNIDCFYPRLVPLDCQHHFTLFSGGKLEIRKGQDVVLSAIEKIMGRIPNFRVASQWYWGGEVDMAKTMNGMGVMKHPFHFAQKQNDAGKNINVIDYQTSFQPYGIDSKILTMLSPSLPAQMGYQYTQCHAAVSPSRAEGGTNLVAMETIAAGLPTLLSNNTGQCDLIEMAPAIKDFYLEKSLQVREAGSGANADPNAIPRMQDWGWPVADEIADRMVDLYQHYEHYQQKALLAAKQIAHYSWQNQVAKMLDLMVHDRHKA